MSIHDVAGVHTGGTYFSLTKEGKIRYKEENEEQIFNYLEGYLTDINTKTDTYEGNEIEKIQFVIKSDPDSNENFIFSCGRHTIFTRNILNRLINIDGDIEKIRFTPYLFDENVKQPLICGAIRHNGDKVKGKYKRDEVPSVEEVKVNGKIYKDYEKSNKFWDDLIPKIKDKLKYKFAEASAPAPDVDEPAEDDDDGIPF